MTRRKRWTRRNRTPESVPIEDCRIATVALLHWLAGDIDGVNEVLKPIEQDPRRAAAILLATLQAVAAAAPELRDPGRIEMLRHAVARMSGSGVE